MLKKIISIIADQTRAYFRELKAEIVGFRPSFVSGWIRFLSERRGLVGIALVLFALFHQLYFWTGYHYLHAGVLYPTDVLFGWDVPRVVGDMLETRPNVPFLSGVRSNVHPLFVLFAKPIALMYHSMGLGVHTSAVAVIAMVQAISVVLVFVFFLLWSVGVVESALFAAMFGGCMICYFSGVVPETGVFAICAVTTGMVLAAWLLNHKRNSHVLWILSGVFTYGITLTNVIKTTTAYEFSEWGRHPFVAAATRATWYVIIVVAIGVTLTFAVGSSFNLIAERWIATPEYRGGNLENLGGHLARNFLFYDVIGGVPSTQIVNFAEDLKNTEVVSYNEGHYSWPQLFLAAVWALMMGASLFIVVYQGTQEERKMLAILAVCIVWDFVFFSRYYVPFEGLLHWSAHIISPVFLTTIFFARYISRLDGRKRRQIQIALAIFVAGEIANNIWVARECVRLLTD